MVVAATTKAAATKTEAIADSTPSLGDDASRGGGATPYGLSIERPRSGTEIKITDDALAGQNDPKFTQAMDLGSGRTMHVRTMEADADNDNDVVEEVVIVRTDIEAPKATAFAKVPGQALNFDLDNTMDADNDGTATNDYTALTVDQTMAAVRALVKSPSFTAGTEASEATLTFAMAIVDNDDVTPGNQPVAAFEGDGTYNGADGTYRCNGTADCTVTLDAKGLITAMSEGWIFTPDAGATSDVLDTNYLHYGVWLKKTTDEDGVLTYDEVETFAGSSIAATGSVAQVTGTATYDGGATGVYVRNVHNSDSTIASATSGHFTADAELTAYFGQTVDDDTTDVDEAGQIAPNLMNTLSGTIDNFELSNGEETAWSVTLMKADIDTNDGTVDDGVTRGGGADGSYTAIFHGPNEDAENEPIQPHTVVGEFGANFSNGSVAGGFGARK